MISPFPSHSTGGDVPGLDGPCHRSGGHISLRDLFDHCIFTVMNKICFTPFPSIATERFNLRPLTIEDENEIFALRSDDSINEYLDRPKANSIDAELSPRNLKSVRLLEKYGFVRKDNANKTGEEENPDSVVYTLSNG